MFAADAFEADLTALGEVVAANAPLSMRQTKRVLLEAQRQRGAGSREFSDAMYARIAASLNSDDAREAMAAFREKTQAAF